MMQPADIDRRTPVWQALSEFYLDTELQPADLETIRLVFAQSGYSIDEIKRINYEEVAPVLIDNLVSPAGVWSGFNNDWLIEVILARLKSLEGRRQHAWFKNIWRWRVDYFTKEYFQQLVG